MLKKLIVKQPTKDDLSTQLTKTANYLLAQDIDGLVRQRPIQKRLRLLEYVIKGKLIRKTKPKSREYIYIYH